MRRNSRRPMRVRLADLERRASAHRPAEEPRVVIYLPRKDGDGRPLGVLYRSGPAVAVLYDRGVAGSGG